MKRFIILISNLMYTPGNYLNTWKIVVAPSKAQAAKIAIAWDKMYPCGVDRDQTIILVDTLSASKAKAVKESSAVYSALHELDYVISRNVQLKLSSHWIKFAEWLDSIRD